MPPHVSTWHVPHWIAEYPEKEGYQTTSGLRVSIVPVVVQKEKSSLIGRDILRLLLFCQSREKLPCRGPPTSASVHLNPQHWLLCHMGLYLLEFEFEVAGVS
jgi:hypothetical protein